MNKETSMSVHEMARYRDRLISQKEFLTDILSKIEKQILALQVERLHLRNTLIGSESTEREILPDASTKNDYKRTETIDDPKNLTTQLDLSITPSINKFEEESEEDDF